MEVLAIMAAFIFALVIIASRVRKLFNPDCGECSGGCGCCQSSIPEHHILINEGLEEVKRDEKS